MRFLLATILFLLCLISDLGAQVLLESLAKQEMNRFQNFRHYYAKRSTPGNTDITFVRLRIEPDLQTGEIRRASVDYKFRTLEDITELDFDLRDEFTVDSVVFRGNQLLYNHNNRLLMVYFGTSISQGTFDSLCIYYHGQPDMSTRAWIRDVNISGASISTLSQPYGAAYWWPCRENLTDKIDSLDVILTVDTPYMAVSNGLQTGIQDLVDKRIYSYKHRYPIATYLVAVTFSKYAEYTQKAWLSSQNKEIDIVNYVFLHNDNIDTRNKTFETVKIMRLFDSLFGPYPFHKEQYGHAQFAWGGGMEHQTMSFMVNFNYDLVAHELAHQWFGDKLTCGSWKEIWLNEGFATYANLLCYDFIGDRQQWYHNLRQTKNSVMSLPGGSVYATDTVDVNQLFDYRTKYQKGAMVMHQLRWLIGDNAFFASLRQYLQDQALAYNFVKQNDLQSYFESNSGMNLDDYFNDWIKGEGYPLYVVKWNQKGRTLELNISQTNSLNSAVTYNVPLPFLVRGLNADTMIRVDINGLNQTYSIDLDFKVKELVFDPEEWVLAKALIQFPIGNADDILIYPNPFGTYLYLSSSKEVITAVEIYDNLGRHIYTDKHEDGIKPGSIVTLNMDAYATGMYYIVVKTDKSELARIIIKN